MVSRRGRSYQARGRGGHRRRGVGGGGRRHWAEAPGRGSRSPRLVDAEPAVEEVEEVESADSRLDAVRAALAAWEMSRLYPPAHEDTHVDDDYDDEEEEYRDE